MLAQAKLKALREEQKNRLAGKPTFPLDKERIANLLFMGDPNPLEQYDLHYNEDGSVKTRAQKMRAEQVLAAKKEAEKIAVAPMVDSSGAIPLEKIAEYFNSYNLPSASDLPFNDKTINNDLNKLEKIKNETISSNDPIDADKFIRIKSAFEGNINTLQSDLSKRGYSLATPAESLNALVYDVERKTAPARRRSHLESFVENLNNIENPRSSRSSSTQRLPRNSSFADQDFFNQSPDRSTSSQRLPRNVSFADQSPSRSRHASAPSLSSLLSYREPEPASSSSFSNKVGIPVPKPFSPYDNIFGKIGIPVPKPFSPSGNTSGAFAGMIPKENLAKFYPNGITPEVAIAVNKMLGAKDPKPDESIYGKAENGNNPWLSQYIHNLLQENEKERGKKFPPIKSPYAPRNALQDTAALETAKLVEESKFRSEEMELVYDTLRDAARTDHFDQFLHEMTGAHYTPAQVEQIRSELNESSKESKSDLKKLFEKVDSNLAHPERNQIFEDVKRSRGDSTKIDNYLVKIESLTNPSLVQREFDLKNRHNQTKGHYDELANELRRENTHHYLTEILPNLNDHYISKGMFHSNARGRHQHKVLEKLQKNLNGELVKLKVHGFEKALEEEDKRVKRSVEGLLAAENIYTKDKDRALNTANTLSNIVDKEKELNLKGTQLQKEVVNDQEAKTLNSLDLQNKIVGKDQDRVLEKATRAANLVNQAQQHKLIAAKNLSAEEGKELGKRVMLNESLDAHGDKQQAQDLSEKNATYKDELAERDNQFDRNIKAMNAALRVPQPNLPPYVQQSTENKPNPWGTAASVAGTFASALLNSKNKKGGLVRNFAKGGQVSLPQVEDDAHTKVLLEHYNKLQEPTSKRDALLMAVAQMAANFQRSVGQTPLHEPLIEAYKNTKQSEALKSERALTLMQQIQASRMKQQELLANLDYQNRHLASQDKHHGTTAAESARHNKAVEELTKKELEYKKSALGIKEDKPLSEKYLSRESQKEVNKNNAEIASDKDKWFWNRMGKEELARRKYIQQRAAVGIEPLVAEAEYSQLKDQEKTQKKKNYSPYQETTYKEPAAASEPKTVAKPVQTPALSGLPALPKNKVYVYRPSNNEVYVVDANQAEFYLSPEQGGQLVQ